MLVLMHSLSKWPVLQASHHSVHSVLPRAAERNPVMWTQAHVEHSSAARGDTLTPSQCGQGATEAGTLGGAIQREALSQ